MKLPVLCIVIWAAIRVTAYNVGLSGPNYIQVFTNYQDSVLNTYRFITHQVHDFSELDDKFYDEISSACSTGLWIFYTERNFTYKAGYDWGYLIAKINSCFELLPEIDNRVRSLRYAGDVATLNKPAYNLYQHAGFAGLEWLDSYSQSDITTWFPQTKSIIITGNASWSFYEEPGYKGDHFCMTPNVHLSSGDLSLDYRVAMTHSMAGVGSIKEGCDTRSPSSLISEGAPYTNQKIYRDQP